MNKKNDLIAQIALFFLLIPLFPYSLIPPALCAAPLPRLGPANETGGRWLEDSGKKFMIFVPADWKVLETKENQEAVRLEWPGPPAASLVVKHLQTAKDESPYVKAENYYGTLKKTEPPLQETKHVLANTVEIRCLVYQGKIEGAFVHTNLSAYRFTAVPSLKAPWSALKNILGTMSDISEDAFRESSTRKPRRLKPLEWVAAVDNSWMIQAAKDGWTSETPQRNDLVFLSGNFESAVLNVSVSLEPAGPIAASDRLLQWGQTLGSKSKSPMDVKLANNALFLYFTNRDQTELIGHLEYLGIIYTVNAYGSPRLDFSELHRLLSTMRSVNAEIMQKQKEAAKEQELPAPPGYENSENAGQAIPKMPEPDPRIKAITDKYRLHLFAGAALLAALYLGFLWMNDKKLMRLGEMFAGRPESKNLELFLGGWYWTLFPTIVAFAPEGVRLAAVWRKPPIFQAVAVIFILRWAAIYFGASKAIIITLSIMLVVFSILLGVALGWAIKGTPCWIYDEKGKQIFKINRRLGWFAYRFVVKGPEQEIIGHLKMSSLSNLIRKQWWIIDRQGKTLAYVVEDSLVKSIMRRLIGHLWGLFRADFKILNQGVLIGRIKSSRSPFNRMTLSAQCPPDLDPRLVFACAVAVNIFSRDRWYPFWSA
ncbi:MAG: hypothetical protein HY747_06265 [Elusimicrobia bacterium]|nr:hypothetical protein [Elusimicrobiota bacterium]